MEVKTVLSAFLVLTPKIIFKGVCSKCCDTDDFFASYTVATLLQATISGRAKHEVFYSKTQKINAVTMVLTGIGSNCYMPENIIFPAVKRRGLCKNLVDLGRILVALGGILSEHLTVCCLQFIV
jgi:hypothetical protein